MSTAGNKKRMQMIVDRARAIRVKQPSLKWTSCIKKASQELKDENKM